MAIGKRAKLPRQRLNIALAFDVDFSTGMEIYEGVREYALRQGNWNLIPLNVGFERVIHGLVSSGKINGMIGSFISDNWLSTSERLRIPVVNVSQLSEVKTVSTVGVDLQAVARDVASRILSPETRAYGFLGIGSQYSSAQLENEFVKYLHECGHQVSVSTRSNESHWPLWLKTLAKPATILATHDGLARRLVGVCKRLRLDVPGDVAIVGVGDVAIESIHAGMELSSVRLPSFEIGREAAGELSRLLEGGSGVRQKWVHAEPMIERESSLRGRNSDVAVDKVLNYVRRNLDQPLQVTELARMAGVSRRSLELRFRLELNTSPYQAILDCRMSHAKKLLKESEQRIHQIAKACGFPTQHPFAAAFKKYAGVSPREFRMNCRTSVCSASSGRASAC